MSSANRHNHGFLRLTGSKTVCSAPGKLAQALLIIAGLGVVPTAHAEAPQKHRAATNSVLVALYASAEQAYRENALEAAEDAYRRLLEVAPGHANAWFQFGNVCQLLGKTTEAMAAYERALGLLPVQQSKDHEMRELAAKVHYNRALLRIAVAQADLEDIEQDSLPTRLSDRRTELMRLLSALLHGSTAARDTHTRPELSTASMMADQSVVKADDRGTAMLTAAGGDAARGERRPNVHASENVVVIKGGFNTP